jgi:hypothetical protein
MYQAPREAGGREAIARSGAAENLPATDATTYFRRLLQRLGIERAVDVVQLLGARVHRTTVHHWLTGRRPAPVWAIDTMRQRLAERAEWDLAITRQPFERGPDRAEHALRLTPARRAKEKARLSAGKV